MHSDGSLTPSWPHQIEAVELDQTNDQTRYPQKTPLPHKELIFGVVGVYPVIHSQFSFGITDITFPMTKSIRVASWPDFLSPGFMSWAEFHLRKCGFSSTVAEYDFLPVNPLIGQPGFPNPWFTYVYMLFIQHEVCPQKKYNNDN